MTQAGGKCHARNPGLLVAWFNIDHLQHANFRTLSGSRTKFVETLPTGRHVWDAISDACDRVPKSRFLMMVLTASSGILGVLQTLSGNNHQVVNLPFCILRFLKQGVTADTKIMHDRTHTLLICKQCLSWICLKSSG